MPGTAKTETFMLGTATVMIGAEAELYDLVPATHSVGLVKNFSMSAEPAYTELTQGVKNNLVYSVLTGNPTRASMEVYEFTAKNFNYALGLDGSAVAPQTFSGTLASPTAGTDDQLVMQTGEGASFTVGDYVMIEVDSDDHVLIRKVDVITTDTLTVDQDVNEVIAANSVVRIVNDVAVGSRTEQPFLSAKVVGKLANGDHAVLLVPKIRITRGFTLNFSTDDFGNLPFEFTVYDLVATDTFFAAFSDKSAHLFRT